MQEELIEDFITRKFPKDELITIKKGKNGADCLLNILSTKGIVVGKILIESKDTKDFSRSWVSKILNDMTNVEADTGIIISKALPLDFPKDQYWSYYEGGLIGLVGFKYRDIYSLLEILRSNIINSKKVGNINNTSNDLKRLWDWITNPKFTTQYRQMHSQAEKMKDQLLKLEQTVNSQTADQFKTIETFQDIQRDWLYDLIKSVGEESLPQELIKFEEKKI